MKRLLALCIGASLLSACGGGGGSSHLVPVPAATGKSQGATKVRVSIRVLVPTANKARKAAAAKLRHALDVSSSTMGASVTVYNSNDASDTTPLATAFANLSSTGTACGAADANDNRICTFSIGAPGGTDTFVLKTYDAVPAGNAPSGNQLGVGIEASVTIGTGPPQTVGFTLNSVLSQIAVTLVPDAVHYLVSTQGTAIVVGQDADGNAIVGNTYMDGNGNALPITVSADSVGGPYLSFGSSYPAVNNFNQATATTTVAGPSAVGVPFVFSQSIFHNSNGSYQGNWAYTAQSNLNGTAQPYSSTITAAANSGAISASAPLSIMYPTFTAVADSTLSVGGVFNGGAAFTGGTFYYTTQGANAGIDTVSGAASQSLQAIAGLSGGMAFDSGTGKIYAGGSGGFYGLADAAPTNVGELCQTTAPPCPSSSGSAVALNPAATDMYYVSGSNLIDYNIAADSATATQIPSITNGGVAVDQNGNVWIANNVVGGHVLVVQPGTNCTVSSPYCLLSLQNANAEPGDVVADPLASDNAMWIADRATSNIFQMNTSGSPSLVASNNLSFFDSGIPPWHMVFDPIRPHILWFDAMFNNVLSVGRLDTQTGWMSIAPFYNASTTLTSNGNEQPGAMAVDPATDNIYMVYDGGGDVVEVTP